MSDTDHHRPRRAGSGDDGPTGRDERDERTSTFASFAVPPFRIIWIGSFLYYLSIFTGIIARGALAKELGGTNTALGVVTLAFGVSSLLCNPIGGVLADRFSKRGLLVISTLLLSGTSLWLGLTELFEVTEFWMLVVVSAVQALAFSLLLPARMAFTAELVGPRLIPNAVALAQVSMNVNRVLGPAMAGAMLGVAWLSYTAIYLSAAVLGALSAGCFALLGPGRPDPDRPVRAPLAELQAGVGYARREPTLRQVMILAIGITMIGFPYVAFLPSVSEDFFDAGAEGFAQLSLVGAVGGLAAGLGVARASLAQGRTIQLWAALGIAAGLWALAAAPTLPLAGLAVTGLGAATAAFQTMNGTLALSVSDPAFHGRVQSLLGLGFSAFGLASLPLGILADRIGLRLALALMGAVVAAIALAVAARPHRSPSPGPEPAQPAATP